MLVQGVNNLQPANKCEGGNFLPTFGDFGELILDEFELQLEAVSFPNSDEKEWWLFLLST